MLMVLSHTLLSQSFSRERFCDYLEECEIKHSDIVYRQACHETGWFTSKAFREHNNLFGFMIKGEYIHFAHWKECVRYYALYQKNRLQPKENYYKFLVRIGYAEDSLYCQKLRKIKFKL